MAAKQYELDRLEVVRQEIADKLGRTCDEATVNAFWTDDAWIEAVCQELSAHLMNNPQRDRKAAKREESLLVILIQTLFLKYGAAKGDHLLAQELFDLVPALLHPVDKAPDKAQVDKLRQRIYRLRNKYGIEEEWIDSAPRAEAPRTGEPVTRPPRGARAHTHDPRHNNELYIERHADAQIEELAPTVGSTLIIYGARGFGKTTVLARYRCLCRQQGKQIALINLHDYRGEQLSSLAAFLTATAETLGIPGAGEKSVSRPQDLTELVEKHILEPRDAPIVLIFDHIDRLAAHAYRNDVFAMLRSWHNLRGDICTDSWLRIDLVLVTAIDPAALIEDPNYSPFAIGRTIVLGPFTLHECRRLRDAIAGRSSLSDECVKDLHELVAGIPALVERAFRILTSDDPPTWQEFSEAAASVPGPFKDYLLAWKRSLIEAPEPDLAEVYRDFIADEKHRWPRPNYEEHEHIKQLDRLLALGLVRLNKVGCPIPASPLHIRYFTSG